MPHLTLSDLPTDLQQRSRSHFLATGQVFIQQGEPARHLFWLATGQMRLVSFIKQRMITHYFVDAGTLFAENALHMDSYGCTAIAEVPSEAIAIPKAEFIEALRQSPELSERYLTSLTQRFQAVKSLLELRSIPAARDRLLHYLMQRRDPDRSVVTLDKPLRAVASDLALAPESLSRLLSRLQAEGIISRKQRRITFSQEWLTDIAE